MKNELTSVDPDIASQLIESITAAEYMETDEPNGFAEEYLRDSDYNMLRITFAIKDYKHLFWTALILKSEDQYYIQINEHMYVNSYLLCSDELASVIKQACDEYSLS